MPDNPRLIVTQKPFIMYHRGGAAPPVRKIMPFFFIKRKVHPRLQVHPRLRSPSFNTTDDVGLANSLHSDGNGKKLPMPGLRDETGLRVRRSDV